MSAASNEQFIRVWQSSETRSEACKRLRMSRQAVYARYALMKRHGVPLKDIERYDWKALALLAEKCAQENQCPGR